MNLQKCDNGHFYDADKYPQCPHCGADSVNQTVALKQHSNDDIPTSSLQSQVDNTRHASSGDDQKTISIFHKELETEPVVGWLICQKGTHFGKDFRLKSGRNFIGRGADMDVGLTGELSVSRDKHAIIIYEPKQNIFLAQPGDSKELFYLNGEVVLTTTKLCKNDVLQVGEVELMFVPCCDDAFIWNKDDSK